jgi:hypothetical protein
MTGSRMDDKYIKGETLGVGTFASVIKATVKEVSPQMRRSHLARLWINTFRRYKCSYTALGTKFNNDNYLQTGQEVAIKKVRIAAAKEVSILCIHAATIVPSST